MLRALALLVGLLLACVTPTWAAVTVVHYGQNTGGSGIALTATMSGSPTNGNVVTAACYCTNTPAIKDSNSVALTGDETIGSTLYLADYVITGGPGTGYAATATIFVYDIGALELSGTSRSGAAYCGNTGTCAVTTHSGDVVFCTAAGTNGVSALTNISGATALYSDSANGNGANYGVATSTSSTCSNAGTTTNTVAADYTLAASPIPNLMLQVIGWAGDGSYHDTDLGRFNQTMTLFSYAPVFARMLSLI